MVVEELEDIEDLFQLYQVSKTWKAVVRKVFPKWFCLRVFGKLPKDVQLWELIVAVRKLRELLHHTPGG